MQVDTFFIIICLQLIHFWKVYFSSFFSVTQNMPKKLKDNFGVQQIVIKSRGVQTFSLY